MAQDEYRVTVKGNTSLADKLLNGNAMEVEHFQNLDDAVLYAALSKQRWETVEVSRITGGNAQLVLRFHRGLKDFEEKR